MSPVQSGCCKPPTTYQATIIGSEKGGMMDSMLQMSTIGSEKGGMMEEKSQRMSKNRRKMRMSRG
ncbi:unnamed protein product [Rhodiola kirilowii]